MTTDTQPLRGPLRKRESHLWERDADDWYVEPSWCSERLFERLQLDKRITIWDPACGMGRILDSAVLADHKVIGSDTVDRGCRYLSFTKSFFDVLQEPPMFKHCNIVSNPPFGLARRFAERALERARTTALLLPSSWVQGDRRSRWLATTPLRYVFFLTPRPSMPPGAVIAAGEKPGNGETDYAWFVWEGHYRGAPSIDWIRKNP